MEKNTIEFTLVNLRSIYDLEKLNFKELKNLAREYHFKGFSLFNKKELSYALRTHKILIICIRLAD